MARFSLIFLLVISLLGAVAYARTHRDLLHFNNINPSLLEIQRINISSLMVDLAPSSVSRTRTRLASEDLASASKDHDKDLGQPITHKTKSKSTQPAYILALIHAASAGSTRPVPEDVLNSAAFHNKQLSELADEDQNVGQPTTVPLETTSTCASTAYTVSDLVQRCLISVLICILILSALVQLICAIKGKQPVPPSTAPVFQVMNMPPDFQLTSNIFDTQRVPLTVNQPHDNGFELDVKVDVSAE